MADTEVSQAEVPHEAPSSAEAPGYDESLLLRIKGKVKRPSKPDDTERNLQVQKLQAEIAKHKARIKDIKDTIDAARTGSRGGSQEQQEIIRSLQQLKNEFQTVLVRALARPNRKLIHACTLRDGDVSISYLVFCPRWCKIVAHETKMSSSKSPRHCSAWAHAACASPTHTRICMLNPIPCYVGTAIAVRFACCRNILRSNSTDCVE